MVSLTVWGAKIPFVFEHIRLMAVLDDFYKGMLSYFMYVTCLMLTYR